MDEAAVFDWLNSLTLKKFSASRNLVIDIDPAFPWQITAPTLRQTWSWYNIINGASGAAMRLQRRSGNLNRGRGPSLSLTLMPARSTSAI